MLWHPCRLAAAEGFSAGLPKHSNSVACLDCKPGWHNKLLHCHATSASQGEGFTWVRNLFTEQPVVTDGKSCNAAQPCAAQPRTICPFVK